MTGAAAPSGLVLREWLALGLGSFGGGATLTMIHRAVTEKHGWVSEDEFINDWALCQICPGINLIAFTILIGKRIAGGTRADSIAVRIGS